ncbi:MAG: hypothetical protein V1866_03045 [archaeon]
MEQFQFLRDKAVEKIQVADHMLFMTYPMIKDPKILLAVIENVYASLDFGVGAILHHEKLFKRAPPFQESFQSRLEVFRRLVVPNYNLNPGYVRLITDVRTVLSEHRKSPVSFVKNDKFVILSPSYKVKTIDVNLAKKYVFETKLFVKNIDAIVRKNERIFV